MEADRFRYVGDSTRGSGQESALARFIDEHGLLYAINLLVLQHFGLHLYSDGFLLSRYVHLELQDHSRGDGGVEIDELAHQRGLKQFTDGELAALLMGVREGEARLTRELERRKRDATPST